MLRYQVLKWAVYNPRKDVTTPSWVRFQHNFFDHPDFYEFDDTDIANFIYILCLASKKNDHGFFILTRKHAETARRDWDNLHVTLKKLQFLGVVSELLDEYEPRDERVTSASRPRTERVSYITNDTNVTNSHVGGEEPTPANPDLVESSVTQQRGRHFADEATEIVQYLNAKSGKKFRPQLSASSTAIIARLKEGSTVEDCKRVIDVKVEEWRGTDMEKFLRPSTLFRPSNFENYLNQLPTKDPVEVMIDALESAPAIVRPEREDHGIRPA